MPISCQDILELAEAYVSNCEYECKRRNVIGRAYYAVYHRADLFHRSLPQPGLAAPDGGKHKQLWYALTNPTVTDNKIKMTSRKIGYHCKDLHAKRVDADRKSVV